MPAPSRRTLLTLMGALALAPSAALGADGKQVDAKKVFPYLDAYLKLPAADRSRFRLAYYFRSNGKPLTAPAWLVDGAQRQPLAVRPDGRVERPPTLAQLEGGKVQIDVEPGTKVGVSMSVEPLLAPARDMAARELTAALSQASTGVRKALGVLAMAMPKLEVIQFHGVTAGEAELADGRRMALPVVKGLVTYDPAKLAGAKTLRFARAPSRLEFG